MGTNMGTLLALLIWIISTGLRDVLLSGNCTVSYQKFCILTSCARPAPHRQQGLLYTVIYNADPTQAVRS
jgi:hypothetical protein